MNLPGEITAAIQAARCVVFRGSRAAQEAAERAEIPWMAPTALARHLGWRPAGQSAPGRRVAASVEEGAAIYAAKHGRAALIAELQARCPTPPLSHADRLAARLPLVFSTAWDDLLLQAGMSELPRAAPIPERPDPSQRLCMSLRGRFTAPATLILTRQDALQRPLSPQQRQQMKALIRGNTVLFVGYRPEEEEFERLFELLQEISGAELPRCHMAVAGGPPDDYLWQKWVWRGLLLFLADPAELMTALEEHLA